MSTIMAGGSPAMTTSDRKGRHNLNNTSAFLPAIRFA
jgi:hypothetical protein